LRPVFQKNSLREHIFFFLVCLIAPRKDSHEKLRDTALQGFGLIPYKRVLLFISAFCFLVSYSLASAKQTVNSSRADGAQTPLRIFPPSGPACAPLAVISPGAGGTENGYSYLAEGLRGHGYLAVVMGHKESGPGTLRSDIRNAGIHGGLKDMVTNPTLQKRWYARPHCRPRMGRQAMSSSLQSSPRPFHGIRYGDV